MRMVIICGLVACGVILFGCKDSTPPAPPTPSRTAPASDGETESSEATEPAETEQSLILYCGRGQSLVGELIDAFEAETGIDVKINYGGTPELAATLREEGDRSPADVFWSQDASALGQLSRQGLFAPLPQEILDQVAANFRNAAGTWVATSGRARILAYSPQRVVASELPQSVFDLTDPKWRGRIGWAPTNGSFLAFLTAMRIKHGDDRALQWLVAMKENQAKRYAKNSPIIEALAAGEIDLGLPNHYYLLRAKANDPDYPVEQTFFQPGDIGNLLMVSGIAVLKTGQNTQAAHQFIRYLLSPDAAQKYFTARDMEYAVIEGVSAAAELPDQDQLSRVAPDVDLDALGDLDGTMILLREAGIQ